MFNVYVRTTNDTLLYSQILFLRKRQGSKLNAFTPIQDLSALSRGGFGGREMVAGQKNDVAIAGGQILGDEYSDHIVKVGIFFIEVYFYKLNAFPLFQNRSGIILRER
jgi:hypothetical protein